MLHGCPWWLDEPWNSVADRRGASGLLVAAPMIHLSFRLVRDVASIQDRVRGCLQTICQPIFFLAHYFALTNYMQ